MWIGSWGDCMGKARQISLCAVMAALALALSFLERFLPLQLLIPLPGIKLGLANTVTLVALYLLQTKYAFWILIPRCLFGSIFGGGIIGLLFSLCGGLLAMLTMALARKVPIFSIYGVSILGAAAHSIGQILAAMVLMRSPYVGGYLPYLLVVSVFTGLLIGSVCAGILGILPKAIPSLPAEMGR